MIAFPYGQSRQSPARSGVPLVRWAGCAVLGAASSFVDRRHVPFACPLLWRVVQAAHRFPARSHAAKEAATNDCSFREASIG